ncbi:MAG: hypothetical protein ACR2OE_10800, partial [Thermomicrobiales bacterium]
LGMTADWGWQGVSNARLFLALLGMTATAVTRRPAPDKLALDTLLSEVVTMKLIPLTERLAHNLHTSEQ